MGQDGFPTSLDEVPPGERLAETFGWFPSLFGLGFIALCAHAARERRHAVDLVVFAVLAAPCFLVELVRRMNRKVLYERDGSFGVYRRGKLSITIPQVLAFHLQPLNTFKYLAFTATVAAVPWVIAAGSKPMGGTFPWLAAGILGVGALASMIYTRLLCRHFTIATPPRKPTFWTLRKTDDEQIVLSAAHARRVRA